MEALSITNEVFCLYATYAVIVLLKMMSVSLFTARMRLNKKVFATQEDYNGSFAKGARKPENYFDSDVERIRRCHRNDLENIPTFLVIGLLYIFTDPTVFAATWHYRIFVISRFCHMFAYLAPLPQPCRGLAFVAGLVTTISMAVRILLEFGKL